jgi:hypothetical protein
VAGLEPFYWTVEYLADPNLVFGTIAAPSDTTNGTGGVNLAWPFCVTNEHLAVAKLTLFAGEPPQDHVIQVRKRFPPNNPTCPFALFVLCDGPWVGNCVVKAAPGFYILNPTVALESRSWGAVKQLFRAPH